jgi:hypothetical protein
MLIQYIKDQINIVGYKSFYSAEASTKISRKCTFSSLVIIILATLELFTLQADYYLLCYNVPYIGCSNQLEVSIKQVLKQHNPKERLHLMFIPKNNVYDSQIIILIKPNPN